MQVSARDNRSPTPTTEKNPGTPGEGGIDLPVTILTSFLVAWEETPLNGERKGEESGPVFYPCPMGYFGEQYRRTD